MHDQGEVTWGVAFQVVGRQQILAALEHVDVRETQLGGYTLDIVEFHSESGKISEMALVCMTSTKNPLYSAFKNVSYLSGIQSEN